MGKKEEEKDTKYDYAVNVYYFLFTFLELLFGFETNQEISQEELEKGKITLKGPNQILACLWILQNKPICTCSIVETDTNIKRPSTNIHMCKK